MEAYSDFARVYDIFMDNVEYEKWAEYLIGSLKEYGIEDGIVLELGCGTGVMTELLAESGYDMIGVDNSEEMLGEAMEKRAESGHEILYLEQDMREFELYGTVRAVVSVCDCMNYITEEEDLLLFDPNATWKKTLLPGGTYTMRELLVPIFQHGECKYESPSVKEIAEFCRQEKKTLWDETKRLFNPHKVYVDLSQKLYDTKTKLLNEAHH